jgi:hypothetical protein
MKTSRYIGYLAKRACFQLKHIRRKSAVLFRRNSWVQFSIFVTAILSGSVFTKAEEPKEYSFRDDRNIPTPVGIVASQSSLAHYQDDVPTIAPGADLGSYDSKDRGFFISASGLYIFDTSDHIKGQTGWGGTIDFSAFIFNKSNGFYAKTGLDFVCFQTNADKEYGKTVVKEEILSFRVHANGGVGYRLYGFDLYGWLGLGLGDTYLRGTDYRIRQEHLWTDFVTQAGAYISYSPTDYCSIYAGYRMMWSLSLEGERRDRFFPDGNYPGYTRYGGDENISILAHAFEVGITFHF